MDGNIFDRWASLPGKAEVALVSAPFTYPPSSSVALSIFKSCLTEAGISSSVLYPIFPLIRTLGMESARELAGFALPKGVTEFLFADLTDVNNESDERSFVEEVFCEDHKTTANIFTTKYTIGKKVGQACNAGKIWMKE